MVEAFGIGTLVTVNKEMVHPAVWEACEGLTGIVVDIPEGTWAMIVEFERDGQTFRKGFFTADVSYAA
jgi:hypothetical protein